MQERSNQKLKIIAISMLSIITAISLASCGSKKNSATGELKRSQYCERYREFDEKVATVEPKEQRLLLEKISQAKDFPESPATLKQDYELVIKGYKQVENGTYNVDDQDIYKKASDRIARHAIDNCELLKSSSGSKL